MDPDTTLLQLLEAAAAQDLDRYQELSDALYGWISSGGYWPHTTDSGHPAP